MNDDLKAWNALAAKDLKGAAPESLTWNTLEGIAVKPLYTAADTAGLAHMGHVRFLVFTFAGAAIWNAALIGGGHFLGSRFGDAIEQWTGPVVLAIVVLALAGYAYRVATWKARPALHDD